MKGLKNVSLLCVIAFVVGCDPNYDMAGMLGMTSQDADKRFDESMSWNKSHDYFCDRCNLLVDDDYVIYVCSDTHVDSTNRNLLLFCEAVRSGRAEHPSTFAIHLGDQINGKGNCEFFAESMGHDKEAVFADSTFYVLGNHDIYFNQWNVFKDIFHTSVYWFRTQSKQSSQLLDLFICLDSAEGTLGEKQLSWLTNLLESQKTTEYRHRIIITHTNFFNNYNVSGHPSNYPLEDTYMFTDLFREYGIDMVWTGHEHSHKESQYGGVKYIVLSTMQDPASSPEYMVVHMGEHIQYNTVLLNKD